MADEAKTFDIYDDKGVALAEAKPSPVTINGLNPNTTYSGWQIAYAGATDKVSVPEFTTEDTELAAPVSIKAAVLDGALDVDIDEAGEATGGSDATGYKVYYTDGTTSKDVTGEELPVKLTGLANGTEYTLSMAILNAAGESAKSPEIKATPAKPVVKMESFKLDKSSVEDEAGKTATVTVYDVLPADTTDVTVVATPDDEKVATVKDNGDATFTVSLLAQGQTTVHFVAKDGGGAKVDLAVKVNKAIVHVESIALNADNAAEGLVGEDVTLGAAISPSNADNQGMTWSSSDETVANFTKTGAEAGHKILSLLKAGTTTITVTSEDGAKTDSFDFVVKDPTPSNIAVDTDENSAIITAE